MSEQEKLPKQFPGSPQQPAPVEPKPKPVRNTDDPSTKPATK
jgi:hypothetical protein